MAADRTPSAAYFATDRCLANVEVKRDTFVPCVLKHGHDGKHEPQLGKQTTSESSAATTEPPTEAQLVRACQLYRQKLDRLHADYKQLAEWASSNAEDDLFAGQVAMYTRARLAEWELPLERWEP